MLHGRGCHVLGFSCLLHWQHFGPVPAQRELSLYHMTSESRPKVFSRHFTLHVLKCVLGDFGFVLKISQNVIYTQNGILLTLQK